MPPDERPDLRIEAQQDYPELREKPKKPAPEKPANRRRVAVTAPYDRWVLLGKLLQGRRQVLGYTYRAPGFERERGINRRLAADLETAAAKRVNHFTEGSLRLAAHGYQVTYSSLVAVLRGMADTLTPAPAELPDEDTPPMAPERAAADRRYYDRINERRVALAAEGVIDPSGEQMFPDSPDDAKVWDGTARGLGIGDRVWLIADLRRRADGRVPNSGTDVTSA